MNQEPLVTLNRNKKSNVITQLGESIRPIISNAQVVTLPPRVDSLSLLEEGNHAPQYQEEYITPALAIILRTIHAALRAYK